MFKGTFIAMNVSIRLENFKSMNNVSISKLGKGEQIKPKLS